MTVTAQNNRIAYSGNGVTTSFSFPYYFIAAADMKVYVDGVLKTLTTHYTISGSAPYTGGANIVFGSAPANAAEIVLLSDPAITQGVDLVDNDDFPVEASVETPLDRLTLICRRLYDLVSRSVRMSDSVSSSFDGEIPEANALEVLRLNAAGTGIESVPVSDLILESYAIAKDGQTTTTAIIPFAQGIQTNTISGTSDLQITSATDMTIKGADVALRNNDDDLIASWADGSSQIIFEGRVQALEGIVAGAYNASSNPAVKTKKLTGTSSGSVSGSVSVAHGLDASKIISVSAVLTALGSVYYLPGYDSPFTTSAYLVHFDANNVILTLNAGASNITSRPFTIWITYEV